VLAVACSSSKPAKPVKHDAAPVLASIDAPAAPAPIDAPEKKLFVHGAGRCGECHEKMYDEWEVSAHAKAATSPRYKASLAAANDPSCVHCHLPLEDAMPHDILTSEGVTCDVCHTMRDPVPGKDGGTYRLAIDDMVKYGPRCDLKDHYFHRMGCSPVHAEGTICGTCHWWEPKGVPVFTEYADWKAGPQASKPCQTCHMPGETALIATGSPKRTGVPHHGLFGKKGDLRTRALELHVTTKGTEVTVALTNNGAGHAVPAGLPERRIVVTVTALDSSGGEVGHDSRELGRVLVDASGTEVPFWKATKVGSDTRIAPGATWKETFTMPAATSVQVDVVHRELSAAGAKALGAGDVEDIPMAQAKVRLK
jgi:hypothetical protein